MKLQWLAVALLSSLRLLAVEAARAEAAGPLEAQGVNVHAVVTDRDGRLAAGLTAADFQVLVDGEPVPLDLLVEVRRGRAVFVPDPGPLPADLEHALAGEPVGTSYLIYLDEPAAPARPRAEILRALAARLDALGPKDEVAIVAWDGSRLAVLADWTRSRKDLRHHLSTLADAAGRRDVPAPQGPAARLLLRTYPSLSPRATRLAADSDSRGQRELARAQDSIYAAAAAQRSFADAPGRKVMLLISQGWRLDWPAGGAAAEPAALLRPLTDAANQLGYTIYPCPPRGHARPNLDALTFAARETGGQVLPPGGEDLWARLAAETGDYYWLGFRLPADAADAANAAGDAPGARRRSVEVEVLRPGAAVRARHSFLPASRETRLALELESAVMTGKERKGF